MPEYRTRVVDTMLAELLAHPGAVLIEGARACGKSATGRHHAGSHVQLDIDEDAARLAELAPERLLIGAVPRFIDEWQRAPRIWNHVRSAVDRNEGPFILAGSAVPADDVTRHSGAGRVVRVRMRPMTLHESGRSTGQVRLSSVFEHPRAVVSAEGPLSVPELAEAITRGGWPGLQSLTSRQAATRLAAYVDDTARVDIPRLDGVPRRDPEGVLRLIRSLARHVATEASVAALARDVSGTGPRMADATALAYLDALARVFVTEDQPSWGPHLRSRDPVRKAPKRHFVDPSLAAASVGADADRLLTDLGYFGQLFESLVVRDLRVYAAAMDAEVRHYRDSAGREVDAIVERRDGTWMAIEVKLAASREDAAAASLRRFCENVDTARTPPPTALMIVTGGKYGYTRDDGIHVVPAAALAA